MLLSAGYRHLATSFLYLFNNSNQSGDTGNENNLKNGNNGSSFDRCWRIGNYGFRT